MATTAEPHPLTTTGTEHERLLKNDAPYPFVIDMGRGL